MTFKIWKACFIVIGNFTDIWCNGSIGSNSSTDKPIPEPMLMVFYDVIWHHEATVCCSPQNKTLFLELYDVVHCYMPLTHWGRVTHICVAKLTIIASDNGLSPGRRKAIIWTNAGLLLIGPLGTTLNEILIEIHTFSFKKMHLKTSSAKWCPFCLGPNVLTVIIHILSVIQAQMNKNTHYSRAL